MPGSSSEHGVYKITRDPQAGMTTDAYENHRWNTFCEVKLLLINRQDGIAGSEIWGKSESDKDLFRRKISNGAGSRKPGTVCAVAGLEHDPRRSKALAWKKVRMQSSRAGACH